MYTEARKDRVLARGMGTMLTTLAMGMLGFTKWVDVVTLHVVWSPFVLLVVGIGFLSCPQLLANIYARKKEQVRDGLWSIRLVCAIPVAAGLLLWLKGWETSELSHGLNVALDWLVIVSGGFLLICPQTLEPGHLGVTAASTILPGGRRWKKVVPK